MERIAAILKDPVFEESLTRTSLKETQRKFCRHTFQHFVDVARITYILLLENGDIRRFMVENNLTLPRAREIVYAAAILHDIGRWKEYETGEDHSVVSADMAQEILPRAGFSMFEIGIIIKSIKEHRKPSENMSLLGEQLYRADNLSRLCVYCEAKEDCYKYDDMETGRNTIIY